MKHQLPPASPPSPKDAHAFARGPRITAIETVTPHEVMPGLLLLRIHTDAGTVDGTPVIGHGESYYLPGAIAAVIHDWMASRLIGADALSIESHWRFLYERMIAFGGTGAELRALSAIDLALWDIAGQLAQQPVWRLWGGPVRSRITVYNSCGGPSYGRVNREIVAREGWPGHGDSGRDGPLEDNWKSRFAPVQLAQELIAAGYPAMKVWLLDPLFRQWGPDYFPPSALREALAPLHAIRDAVGDQIELMIDGHGFFSLAAGRRIAEAMQPLKPLWLEDVIRPDSVETLAEFRRVAGCPTAVSEMLTTRDEYRRTLELRAADYVMIDPTWVGGLSESRRMAEQAALWNISVLMHDCTGPLTLLAGLQVAAAVPRVTFQETVRAHLATFYQDLIDEPITVEQGSVALPERPGLGRRLLPRLFDETHPGYRRTELA